MARTSQVVADVERDWAATGLRGSLLARNLRTGRELAMAPTEPWPLASVVKLPLALVAYDAFARGTLDPAEPFETTPDDVTRGPTGISLFRHPSRVAAEDLVQLSLALSDNAAADLLLGRLGLDAVNDSLRAMGLGEVVVRHPIRAIFGTHRTLAGLDLALAATGATPGGGHLVPELDPHRANVGTARVLADLLTRVWTDAVSTPEACARLREALSRQPTRHRMAVELASDATRVSSKTGTFLQLRHEAGVVEQQGEDPVVVVALTRSALSATEQLESDFAIGHAARLCVEALR